MKKMHEHFQAAGITSLDERGPKADFHARRKIFCTWLADAGVSDAVRMKLARIPTRG